MLRVDLGEVRGFAYYTGAIFHVLAAGPGEPIGAGGRYDDLLARFDAPMPAVGFALDLDAVAWAREAAGVHDAPPPSAVVACRAGGRRRAAARRAARPGRRRGRAPRGGRGRVRRRWRFTHVVTVDGDPGPRRRVRRSRSADLATQQLAAP